MQTPACVSGIGVAWRPSACWGAPRRRRAIRTATLLALPLALLGPEMAATSVAGPVLESAVEVHNGLSEFKLPRLSREQVEDLASGRVLIVVEDRRVVDLRDQSRHKLRYRALALHLTREAPERLWLTFRDPHFVASQNLSEELLYQGAHGERVQYQHYRMPWPLRDRQSIVRSEPALELARETDDRMWELAWTALAPDDVDVPGNVDPDSRHRAIWLPVNTGAWTQITLDSGHTLVAFQLTVLPGGRIPVALARVFAKRELNKFFSDLRSNAARVPAHYVAGHEPIFGGDGRPIAPLGPKGDGGT